MPTPVNSSFTRYEFSDEELFQAFAFSPLTRMAIQNEIAIAAEEKIALKFDPSNPLAFAQQEAELAGKIGILQFLLAQQATLKSLTQE